MPDGKPRGLARLRQRLSSSPGMQEKFDEQVRPVIREVRGEMQGQPEDAVYAELTRRLSAAGVEVPAKMEDNLRNVAGRISRGGRGQ